jgi:hypothetical protein
MSLGRCVVRRRKHAGFTYQSLLDVVHADAIHRGIALGQILPTTSVCTRVNSRPRRPCSNRLRGHSMPTRRDGWMLRCLDASSWTQYMKNNVRDPDDAIEGVHACQRVAGFTADLRQHTGGKAFPVWCLTIGIYQGIRWTRCDVDGEENYLSDTCTQKVWPLSTAWIDTMISCKAYFSISNFGI